MRNTVLHMQAKVHPVTASISAKFWEMKEDIGLIFVSLTVLEIFAWIVNVLLT